LTSVGWRLAHHPQDQARLDAFQCAIPVPRATGAREPRHSEPYAVEAQKLLRGTLYPATRNSRALDWRYLVAIDEDDEFAAALVHLRSPDFATRFLPEAMPARLLLAIAVRVDLRGAGVSPSGIRLIDEALAQAIDDARVDTGGGVLFAEVHQDNHRMHVVLTRNSFTEVATVKDADPGNEYAIYALEL